MARKAGKRHLKRIAAPRAWRIERKQYKWALKPKPGRHATQESMALAVALRDLLRVVGNSREAKKIIKSGNVLVDGRVARDEKMAVGLMDVLSFPRIGKHYRLVFDMLGHIYPVGISASDMFKLCRVQGKTIIRGGKTQVNLHDSRNVLTDQKVGVGDVLKISLPDQKLLEVFEYAPGNVAFVIKGKHIGLVGRITKVEPGTATRDALAEIEVDGGKFSVPKACVFVVGRKEPAIQLK